MGTQAGMDPNAFGPFGALFQNYFSALENLGQMKLPLNGAGSFGFDPQIAVSQATAPLKAAARCQVEVLGLMNRRTQAYMQVPTRLAQCRSPQDLLNEQLAFWRTAAEQYRTCAVKIGEACGQALPFSLSEAGKFERDYINFNGTGSKESNAVSPRQDTAGKQQRRVA
ncbi:hypothetical protein [Hyphomicrobium sp.]|uniref:hypothetical protein n=1 Tax=Hyphomicrobium sp. TaxID=82 RepID=UPI002E375BCD|nr:hypothetical protein [Hyphomicrobium sp.]HEX2841945.1 hypothetical protein [Hyphomicrobium sp.]